MESPCPGLSAKNLIPSHMSSSQGGTCPATAHPHLPPRLAATSQQRMWQDPNALCFRGGDCELEVACKKFGFKWYHPVRCCTWCCSGTTMEGLARQWPFRCGVVCFCLFLIGAVPLLQVSTTSWVRMLVGVAPDGADLLLRSMLMSQSNQAYLVEMCLCGSRRCPNPTGLS